MNGREMSHSAMAARKKKKEKFTALLHQITGSKSAQARGPEGPEGSASGTAEHAGLYSQAGAAASANDRRA